MVRGDLRLSKGKLAAQVSHASVTAADRSDCKRDWLPEQKKVVVECGSLDELLDLHEQARQLGLSTALIRDAGHTEIPSGTITCLGIGPAAEEELDKVTGNLKLL